MGYAVTLAWGNPYEILAGFAESATLSSVVADLIEIGQGSFPTAADLNGGAVIGAYCDVCIPSITNTGGADNWIKSDAAYPQIQIVPTGHSAIDAISSLSLACYCPAAATYPYNWIPGDENFASIFTPGSHYFGHALKFYLHNIRSEIDSLTLNSFIFRFRFYVR